MIQTPYPSLGFYFQLSSPLSLHSSLTDLPFHLHTWHCIGIFSVPAILSSSHIDDWCFPVSWHIIQYLQHYTFHWLMCNFPLLGCWHSGMHWFIFNTWKQHSLKFCHSSGYAVISHCHFDLNFSIINNIRIFSCTCHQYTLIFSVIQIFCEFKFFYLLILAVYKNTYAHIHIQDTSSLSNLFLNIFSLFVDWLFLFVTYYVLKSTFFFHFEV